MDGINVTGIALFVFGVPALILLIVAFRKSPAERLTKTRIYTDKEI